MDEKPPHKRRDRLITFAWAFPSRRPGDRLSGRRRALAQRTRCRQGSGCRHRLTDSIRLPVERLCAPALRGPGSAPVRPVVMRRAPATVDAGPALTDVERVPCSADPQNDRRGVHAAALPYGQTKGRVLLPRFAHPGRRLCRIEGAVGCGPVRRARRRLCNEVVVISDRIVGVVGIRPKRQRRLGGRPRVGAFDLVKLRIRQVSRGGRHGRWIPARLGTHAASPVHRVACPLRQGMIASAVVARTSQSPQRMLPNKRTAGRAVRSSSRESRRARQSETRIHRRDRRRLGRGVGPLDVELPRGRRTATPR